MKAEEIREGDIVEIDYIAEFTKEHINEGKALVIWKGFNHQPLVRKLNTRATIWTCYEHIARVIGHTDIEGCMDYVINTTGSYTPLEVLEDFDFKTLKQEPILDKLKQAREEIENEVKFWSEPSTFNVESLAYARKAKVQSYKHCLEILDRLIESEG